MGRLLRGKDAASFNPREGFFRREELRDFPPRHPNRPVATSGVTEGGVVRIRFLNLAAFLGVFRKAAPISSQ